MKDSTISKTFLKFSVLKESRHDFKIKFDAKWMNRALLNRGGVILFKKSKIFVKNIVILKYQKSL